ncbi:hypothetical protein LINPERPRIM_LOCUS23991 [Linum perenne]
MVNPNLNKGILRPCQGQFLPCLESERFLGELHHPGILPRSPEEGHKRWDHQQRHRGDSPERDGGGIPGRDRDPGEV